MPVPYPDMTSLTPKLDFGKRTLVMGVVNVTPDSFSDGGLYLDPSSAISHALSLLDQGADIIDIGGESTRPATFRDQKPLSVNEELARILPVIEGVLAARTQAFISIDTYKAEVAKQAVQVGASIINDVSGLSDPNMATVAAESSAYLVIMHMPGTPHHMLENPDYGPDLIEHIAEFLQIRIDKALDAGVAKSRIIVDPGIGFGKNTEQNCEIIRRLSEIKELGCPVMSGPSRKRFIGALMGGAEPTDRLPGTAATVALSIVGEADIVRVHDVEFIAKMVKVCDGVVR